MTGLTLALLVGLTVTGPPDGLVVDHEPLTCAVAERFTRIEAAVTPAREFASARVEFRASADGPWYSVGMTGDADSLVAVLPRAGAALSSFGYRVVTTGTDGRRHPGPVAVVPVRPASECASQASVNLSPGAPIVVAVPPGAPVVPPVPPGFNPAGAISESEAAGNHPSRLGPIAGGAAVLGGLGGLAAVFGSHAAESTGFGASVPDPDLKPARVTLVGSDPPPGSTISVATQSLTLRLQIDSLRITSQDSLGIQVLLQGAGLLFTCVRMSAQATPRTSPFEVSVDGPLEVSRACAPEFDVRSATVVVTSSVTGQLFVQTGSDAVPDLAVDYHFVP